MAYSSSSKSKTAAPEKKASISYWSKDKCDCPICKKPFEREIMRSGNGRMNAGNLSDELHRDYIPSATMVRFIRLFMKLAAVQIVMPHFYGMIFPQ